MKNYDINWGNFFRFLTKLNTTCYFSSDVAEAGYATDGRGNRLIKVLFPIDAKIFIGDNKRYLWAFAVEVLHDCGHLIVAPEERRDKPDFGIPEDAEGIEVWDIEEMKACLIEQELCDLLKVTRRFRGCLFRNVRFKHLCHGRKKEIKQWWKDCGKQLTHDVFKNGLNR